MVGIGYRPVTIADVQRLRQRDFLPVVAPRGDGDPAMMQGANQFTGFLEEELEPCILDRFDVARGDLGVFGSPSYWYAPKVIIEIEESYASTNDDLPAKVYVSIGEYETSAGDDRHREQSDPEGARSIVRR